jgi:hypothetical protein
MTCVEVGVQATQRKLLREWLRSWEAWSAERLKDVTGTGISIETLAAARTGIETITVTGNLYAPDDTGELALILPVIEYIHEPHLDADGYLLRTPVPEPELVLVDLVACALSTPSRCWRRRGEPAVLLGGQHLEEAAREGAPLHVFRKPLDWLRSGCQGVVLINRTGLRSAFLGINRLEAEDLEHGKALHAWLHQPDDALPVVHVPSLPSRSAA